MRTTYRAAQMMTAVRSTPVQIAARQTRWTVANGMMWTQ
jgi:hypothetical protein